MSDPLDRATLEAVREFADCQCENPKPLTATFAVMSFVMAPPF